MQCTFRTARLSDFRPVRYKEDSGKPIELEVGGLRVTPTERFFESVSREFAFPETIYRLFSFAEVSQRVVERNETTVRYCVERDKDGRYRLLAISSLRRAVPNPANLIALLETCGAQEMKYADGVLTSFFTPPSAKQPVSIGPDSFLQRLALVCPIDSFGAVETYLSMLRLVCSNGMVGYAPAFRSQIRVGSDILHSIEREIRSFDGGEGYTVIAQRLESAQRSPASLHEVQRLYRLLRAQHHRLGVDDVLPRLDRMSGDLCARYGEANLDAFPPKRQKLLPAGCRVYDLINFSTELASHHANPIAARALHAHVGMLISEEYDLEGAPQATAEFRDVFFDPSFN